MSVRGCSVALAVLAGVIVHASSGLAAPPPRQAARPGSFGIQLLGAPASARPDPLARNYIVGRLAPGTSISRRVEISNSTRSTARVAVYVAAAGLRRGRFGFAAGRKPNELSRWASVSRSVLRLPPGGKGLATVRIKAPRRASPGERYAVVWAEMSAPGRAGGGVRLVNRVGVRIYLTVGRGGLGAANFAVGALRAKRSASGLPVVVATVRNSGGRTLTINGAVTLSNGPAGLRSRPFAVKPGAALAPGSSEQATVSLDRHLPRGPWHAELRLRSGLIERTVAATITFPRPAPARAASGGRNLSLYAVIGLLGLLAVAGSALALLKGGASGIGRA